MTTAFLANLQYIFREIYSGVSLNDLQMRATDHLLTGMILQVSRIPKKMTCNYTKNPPGAGKSTCKAKKGAVLGDVRRSAMSLIFVGLGIMTYYNKWHGVAPPKNRSQSVSRFLAEFQRHVLQLDFVHFFLRCVNASKENKDLPGSGGIIRLRR